MPIKVFNEVVQTEKKYPPGETSKATGKRSKWKATWEFKLLPATFEIEYLTKLVSNPKKIIKDFGENGRRSPGEINSEFFHRWVKKNWSEYVVSKKMKRVRLPAFEISDVYFLNLYDENSLNFLNKRMTKNGQKYTIVVMLEAKNETKRFDKKDFERIVKDLAPYIENILLKDTPYFSFVA